VTAIAVGAEGYEYRYDGGVGTQAWISDQTYLVVDIAAGPVQYSFTFIFFFGIYCSLVPPTCILVN
jgi:hypothetical protein